MNNNKRVLKLTEFIAHGSNVTSCAIGHKCNRIAATGGEDKKVNLWTLNKPTCIMSLTGHTSPINSITFSSNEDKIVSGSSSGSLKVWDLEVNRLICNLVGHKANVTCLEYHGYADYIASGSIDAQIRLWDLRRKGCIFTYKGHTSSVNALRFSPDSKWIASVSDDNLVKIWDLKAGRLLTDLKGHIAPVNSLEFHPNEFLLATGSTDRTVKFWDLEKMENVSTSPPSPNGVKVILFEPNGKCLFSASQDYLHSLSWEPSECYDAVFCQWKHVVDMTINSNKLISASYNHNMVSFFAVDLLQVAPVGVSQKNENTNIASSTPFQDSSINDIMSNRSSIPANSVRRNFKHFEQIEASEQPDENQILQQIQNDIVNTDNTQANIYNEEEYNKIFRPSKEIERPSYAFPPQINPSIPASSSNQDFKKLPSIHKKRTESLDNDKFSTDKSYFIDIKVNNPPSSQVNNNLDLQNNILADPIQKLNINSNNNNSNLNQIAAGALPIPPPIPSSPNSVSKPELKPNENQYLNDNNQIIKEKKNLSNFVRESQAKLDNSKNLSYDFTSIIQDGHESLMKALRNRNKHIQIIRSMWTTGNIKSALDAAVNLGDDSLIADILNQINSSPNIWSLDISTILLPSIKNLIASKYEEHMQIGAESCKIILKSFGKLIKSNLNVVPVGVDITREERQGKCRACYNYFLEIINTIDKKIPIISSNRLVNTFREINLLMKTIE